MNVVVNVIVSLLQLNLSGLIRRGRGPGIEGP